MNKELETCKIDSLASLYEELNYLQMTRPDYVKSASYCLFKDGHIDNAIATYNNECLSYENDVIVTFKDFEIAEKFLKAQNTLEIIKELFDFDFAIRFGDNQPIIKITNKRNGLYWELPETTKICDLLKEVLL